MVSAVNRINLDNDQSHDIRLVQQIEYLTLEKVDEAAYLVFKNIFPTPYSEKLVMKICAEPLDIRTNDGLWIKNKESGLRIAKSIAQNFGIPFISDDQTVVTVIRTKKDSIPIEVKKGVIYGAGITGKDHKLVVKETAAKAKADGFQFIEGKWIAFQDKSAST